MEGLLEDMVRKAAVVGEGNKVKAKEVGGIVTADIKGREETAKRQKEGLEEGREQL